MPSFNDLTLTSSTHLFSWSYVFSKCSKYYPFCSSSLVFEKSTVPAFSHTNGQLKVITWTNNSTQILDHNAVLYTNSNNISHSVPKKHLRYCHLGHMIKTIKSLKKLLFPLPTNAPFEIWLTGPFEQCGLKKTDAWLYYKPTYDLTALAASKNAGYTNKELVYFFCPLFYQFFHWTAS